MRDSSPSSNSAPEVLGPPSLASVFAFAALPLLLAAIAFVVYWPSLNSDFVYDARYEIMDEGFVTSLANLPAVLSLKVLGMHLMLADRPGQMLFLMLNAALWGRHPWGFHLANNLLHAANVALLLVLLRRLITVEDKILAGLDAVKVRVALVVVTAIFALHPIMAEPVAGVNYSSDLLVTFFTLVALLAATIFRPENMRIAFVSGGVCTLCAFAAVTCKESGLATSALLAAYWFLYRRRESVVPWVWLLGLSASVTVAFLAARFWEAIAADVAPTYLGGSLAQVLWIQPLLWVFMMKKLVWPAHFSADYTLENASPVSTPLALVVLVLVVAGQIALALRSRLGALGVLTYWSGLATVSNLMPLFRIVGDRFYYLPLVGVAMQLLALYLLLANSRFAFWIAIAPVLIALVPFTILTVQRQAVFANEFALWSDTLRVSPASATAHYNFGYWFLQQGRIDEAMEQFKETVALDPSYVGAWIDMGCALSEKGRWDEAMVQFQHALEAAPHSELANYNFGLALAKKGQIDEAIVHYRNALDANPTKADVHHDLGTALLQKREVDAAIEHLQESVRLEPDFPMAHYDLGLALLQKGKTDEAVTQFKMSLTSQSDPAQVCTMIGATLQKLGYSEAALSQFQKAAEIDPNNAVAHENLGNLFSQKGEADKAIAEYRKAAEIKPDDGNAHYNLGIALLQGGNAAEAAAQFQDVLRLNPKDSDAQNNLKRARSQVKPR